jgi:hypothetical protein
MNIARVRSFRLPLVALVFIIGHITLSVAPAFAAEVIVLRSGNAPTGSPDPLIDIFAGPGGAPLSAAPFTPGDFDQACNDVNAIVAQPNPFWLQELACDPEARWIAGDVSAYPFSALFCYTFEIQTPCIQQANLSFCWASDDNLGDALAGGPNPDGVYLNGVAVSPGIFGGNYATETLAPLTDVTSLVVPGTNRLEIYNRDIGYSVAGVIFSATLEVTECPVPTENTTWGEIKTLFH